MVAPCMPDPADPNDQKHPRRDIAHPVMTRRKTTPIHATPGIAKSAQDHQAQPRRQRPRPRKAGPTAPLPSIATRPGRATLGTGIQNDARIKAADQLAEAVTGESAFDTIGKRLGVLSAPKSPRFQPLCWTSEKPVPVLRFRSKQLHPVPVHPRLRTNAGRSRHRARTTARIQMAADLHPASEQGGAPKSCDKAPRIRQNKANRQSFTVRLSNITGRHTLGRIDAYRSLRCGATSEPPRREIAETGSRSASRKSSLGDGASRLCSVAGPILPQEIAFQLRLRAAHILHGRKGPVLVWIIVPARSHSAIHHAP